MKLSLTLSLMLLILCACSAAPARKAASENVPAGGEVENRGLLSRLYYYQNLDEKCGVIIGPESEDLASQYKFKVMKDGQFLFGDVGRLGTTYSGGGAYLEHFELSLTKKYKVVLNLEKDGKTFEFFETKQGLFGTKRVRTLCDEMVPVSSEEFAYPVRW